MVNNTQDLDPLLEGRKIIIRKWVYKNKYVKYGSINTK